MSSVAYARTHRSVSAIQRGYAGIWMGPLNLQQSPTSVGQLVFTGQEYDSTTSGSIKCHRASIVEYPKITTAEVCDIHDYVSGSTNVLSNASGTVAGVLDYYLLAASALTSRPPARSGI